MMARRLRVSPVTSVTRRSQNVIQGETMHCAAVKATIKRKGEQKRLLGVYGTCLCRARYSRALLVAQGFHGIELGRFDGRPYPEKHADSHRNGKASA